jgi:hypothetical protein
MLLCLALLSFIGCEEEPLLTDKNIIEFKIGSKRGVINQTSKTISVIVDTGTELTSLAPELIISEGAVVYPKSREAVNISSPISYTVKAEDGTSQSYQVTVSYPASATVLSSLVIKAPPLKTVYERYESFDSTGLAVVGFYSDGVSKNEDRYELSEPDTTTEGTKAVTVTIGSTTATFNIQVRASRLESIVISKLPNTTTYEYGATALDTTGLIVSGVYSDGSSESVVSPAISGFNGSQAGVQEILVSVNGKIATFEVTVLPQKVLESITVSKLPDTAVYEYGATALDTTGLIVSGVYSDGTSESVESPAISGFNGSQAGVQEILVSVNGKTTTFEVTVLPQKVLESIAITEKPDRVLYIPEEQGTFEELGRLYEDLINGLVVTGTYSDGSTAIEELTEENISGFNPDKSGLQTLRLTVGEQAVTFVVDIVKLDYIEVSVQGKTVYLLNEALDLSGFVITGCYSDATTRREIITDANISGFDSSKVGAGKEVTVTVGRQKAYFTVNVYEETSFTIDLASDLRIEVYGLPEATENNPNQTIFLSLSRSNELSDMVVISTTSDFSDIRWTIDGKPYSTDNIITIRADDYTFGGHVIGFIGKRAQAEYSRTLKFSITH